MVDAVGTVGSSISGMTAATTSAQATAATTSSTDTTKMATERLSPVMTSDPLSGVVITEYLDQGGKVSTQVPSSVAIAYMRMGLSPDGTKETTGTSVVA